VYAENDINVSGIINSNVGCILETAAAGVCGIRHLGIDDERSGLIVVPDLDPDSAAPFYESPFDRRMASIMVLINVRRVQLQIAALGLN